MTLNYSRLSAYLPEENFVSPMRVVNSFLVEGVPERNSDSFGRSQHMTREFDDFFTYGVNGVESSDSPQSVPIDVIDLLPSDPFGMNISSTFSAAINGLLGDLEMDYGGYDRSGFEGGREDNGLFTSLNLILDNAVRLQSFCEGVLFDNKRSRVCMMDGYSVLEEPGNSSCNRDVDFFSSDPELTYVFSKKVGESPYSTKRDGAVPHEALFFVLSYLEVCDRLSVQRVCRSFRVAVQSDPLVWRSIQINHPLNKKITDDILVQLSSRAEGNLQVLSLVECPLITDKCLRDVLKTNPRLTKLCVPGCTRLRTTTILNCMKAFKSNRSSQGIQLLRIGGLRVTHEHFEELKLLLNLEGLTQRNIQKRPLYYRGSYLSSDDKRALDIEKCPMCQRMKLVYDCPALGCQKADRSTQACRACTLCIPRCVKCGRCFTDGQFEETFFLELICLDCFRPPQKYLESQHNVGYPTEKASDNQYELSFGG